MKLKAEGLEGGIDFFNPRKMLIAVIAYYRVYTRRMKKHLLKSLSWDTVKTTYVERIH